MFKLYFYSDFEKLSDKELSEIIESMPLSVKERAGRYKKEDDRKKSFICYNLLKNALENDYGISSFELLFSEKGKPYLKDRNDIFFSISHSKRCCVCVISDREIGVDAEEIKPFSQRLAEKVCSENELLKIENSPDKAREFTKIWTMKESFIKMTGEGFSHGLKEADTTKAEFFTEEKESLFISVCESE